MERSDFVENRKDVIKNIYKLYSYTKSSNIEIKDWALQRFKQGHWYVVEPFGDILLFAPSRFVGYKNNTREKHVINHGNGIHTNARLHELRLYEEATDNYVTKQFQSFMETLGIEKESAKFLIPYGWNVADLQNQHKCYFICPTHCKGQKEIAWKSFLDHGVMAVGWEDKDYSDYTIDEISREYLGDNAAINAFSSLKQIREGDVICCTNNGYGLWGIGLALSSYKYQYQIHYAGKDDKGYDSFYSHYVDVAWLCFNEEGYIPINKLNIQSDEKQWPPYGTLIQKKYIPKYVSNYLLKKTNGNMNEEDRYTKYIKLLEANRNLILTGAPGTGKTYLAKAIANAMGAEYDFVQFHPSYDYTDFVEGLRPTVPDRNGNIGFVRKDGIFKTFCKKAIPIIRHENISDELVVDIPHSFDDAYCLLIKAIKENNITLYSDFRNNPKVLNVVVNEEGKAGRVGMRFYKTNNFQNVQLEYLEKIYNFYVSQNKYDIRSEGKKQFEEIIGNTLDYSYYRGIVQGLLDLTKFGSNTNLDVLEQNIAERETNLEEVNSVQTNSKKYIFIIDEINRGEISKIFGELFFSIDPGYRGKVGLVKTQYQNMITDKSDPFYEGFYVPENVYIIGTMNDIDRSVESMDFAMRRRFAWEEVKAAENTAMLDSLSEMKEEVIGVMNRLNNAIWNTENNIGIDGLGIAYHIGGSYFTKLSLYLNREHSNKNAAYKHLWENHLKGVLSEYLRGTLDASENLRLLEKVYYNQDNNDIEG